MESTVAFWFALIPALIGMVCNFLDGKPKRAFGVAIVMGPVMYLVNRFILGGSTSNYFLVAPFGPYFGFFVLNVAAYVCAEWTMSYIGSQTGNRYSRSDDKPGMIASIVHPTIFVLAWVVLVGADLVNPQPPISRPIICSPEFDTRDKVLANLLEVKEDNSFVPNIDLAALPQKSGREAYLNALAALSTDMASWLEVNPTGYLEKINGRQFWYFDLNPRRIAGEEGLFGNTFNTYFKKGGNVPGYIRVEAANPLAKGELVSTQPIKYVFNLPYRTPDGQTLNADAKFYYEFELLRGVIADDKGVEARDDGTLIYTSAILQPQAGLIEAQKVVGALMMDPSTGVFSEYSIDDLPADVDRIFSENYVTKVAQYWGQFSEATWCPQANFDKRLKIDRMNYLFTKTGMLYQLTFTDESRATQIAKIWYVDPRTGKVVAVKPAIQLSTIESVDQMITDRVRTPSYKFSPTAEADNCLLANLLGEQVVYCILVQPDEKIPGGATNMGYAFFRVRFATTSTAKLIAAPSLSEAYSALQRQIAEDANTTPDMSKTVTQDVYKGKITKIGLTGNRYVFKLNTFPKLTFVANYDGDVGIVMALTQVGDEVTVGGIKDPTKNNVQVGSICNPYAVECQQ